MGKLAAALRWAARGFRVFPLQVDSKDPLDMAWTELATTDPVQITAWWTDPVTGFECDNNIGCLTSELIVLDTDTKAGKQGLHTFMSLALEWDTLVTRTPSGGYHSIYASLPGQQVGQHPLGLDLDIRSHHGFIVAPGSTIGGAEYAIELDLPIAPFPEHLRHMLRPPKTRVACQSIHLDLDTPEAIEIAIYWLTRDAPIAVEGRNGDDTTYRVACRLRDLGLAEETAAELMGELYNPRCEPPWNLEELRGKVANAWQYASGEPGSGHPAALLGEIVAVAPPSQPNSTPYVNGSPYRFGNMLQSGQISARPWVMGGILLSGDVTELIAAGGAGKSTLKLTIAAHLVLGREFMGHRVMRPGRAIVYDAEDNVMEMSRRLTAICLAYGMPAEEVRDRLALLSSDTLDLRIAEGFPPKINEEQIAQLIQVASAPDIVFGAFGPLADIHTTEENNSLAMKYVVRVLRLVAQRADIAVLVEHHTGKPPLAAVNAWVGDQNAGRGASSIPQAARVVLTLFSASEKDCDAAGIPPGERRSYVRLDGAKANFSASATQPVWLRWHTIALMTGDDIGVLMPHDVAAATAHMAHEIGAMLRKALMAQGAATLTIGEAVSALQKADQLFALEGAGALKRRLMRVLSGGLQVEEYTLRLGDGDRKTGAIVIME